MLRIPSAHPSRSSLASLSVINRLYLATGPSAHPLIPRDRVFWIVAEQLWHAAAGSTDADALDVLTLLIADYKTRHFPIADPDPIQFLEYVMESRGLTRKDLEPYLGSRARVAEVLNRNRALTLEMIRRLSEGL